MVCKISQGSGFGGAVDYVMGKQDAELLDSKDVRSYDSKLVAKDFEMISMQNRRVTKPVYHISVSFHKNDTDKITNEKMRDISKTILEGMGFSDAQYIVVRHNDAAHPHFHIVTSRVDMNIKTVSDKNNFFKLNRLRKEIENSYPQLTKADGKNLDQYNPLKLKGIDEIKYKIYKYINIEIQKAINIQTFIKNLQAQHNITTELKYRRGSTDVVEGIKFKLDDKWISGSKIDKQCSYINLLKQISKNPINTKITKEISTKHTYIKSVKGLTNIATDVFKGNNYDNGVHKKRNWTNEEELER